MLTYFFEILDRLFDKRAFCKHTEKSNYSTIVEKVLYA